jgi:hypothetical protein
MIFQPQPEDCQEVEQTGGDTPSNMTHFTSISFAFNCKSTFIHNININRYDDVSWQSHPLVFHKIARKIGVFRCRFSCINVCPKV